MPGGQPTKLTDTLQDKIVSLIAAGNYIETACQACGIDDLLYYQYTRNAKEALEKPEAERTEHELRLIEFYKATKKAHSEAEAKLLSELQSPTVKDWQRLAWVLERTRQDKYALKAKLDISNKEPIRVIFETVKEG
jgi:hypothetical protein